VGYAFHRSLLVICCLCAALVACEDDAPPPALQDADAGDCAGAACDAGDDDVQADADAVACEFPSGWDGVPATVRVQTLNPFDGLWIVLFVEIEAQAGGAALRARVCKEEGHTFLNDIAVRIETREQITVLFDGIMVGSGDRCTGWEPLEHVDELARADGLRWQAHIVAPVECEALWDEACVEIQDPACGYCWRTEETAVQRECR